MNQVASLERRVRDLDRELQLRNADPPAAHVGPPGPQPPQEA
jgi:hypothetical protein